MSSTNCTDVVESPTLDKEQLFRTLCVDAHVAQLWKLKTKTARSRSNDSTRRSTKVKGFAKNFCFSKNPILLWKWMGGSRFHSEFFCVGKSSQNSPKPVLICWSSIRYTMCILSVHTLLNVVGYFDLSVLPMSVMGFQNKLVGVGGWGGVSSIQVFF